MGELQPPVPVNLFMNEAYCNDLSVPTSWETIPDLKPGIGSKSGVGGEYSSRGGDKISQNVGVGEMTPEKVEVENVSPIPVGNAHEKIEIKQEQYEDEAVLYTTDSSDQLSESDSEVSADIKLENILNEDYKSSISHTQTAEMESDQNKVKSDDIDDAGRTADEPNSDCGDTDNDYSATEEDMGMMSSDESSPIACEVVMNPPQGDCDDVTRRPSCHGPNQEGLQMNTRDDGSSSTSLLEVTDLSVKGSHRGLTTRKRSYASTIRLEAGSKRSRLHTDDSGDTSDLRDSVYEALKEHFLKTGRGRRIALPHIPHLTNRILAQFNLLKHEGSGTTWKRVSKWFDELFPGQLEIGRIRGAMQTAASKDLDAVVDFNAAAPPLAALGLNKPILFGDPAAFSCDVSSLVINNEVIFQLVAFIVKFREVKVISCRAWVRRFLELFKIDSSFTDGQLMLRVAKIVKSIKKLRACRSKEKLFDYYKEFDLNLTDRPPQQEPQKECGCHTKKLKSELKTLREKLTKLQAKNATLNLTVDILKKERDELLFQQCQTSKTSSLMQLSARSKKSVKAQRSTRKKKKACML